MRRWIWIAIVIVIAAAAYVMIGDVNAVADRLGAFHWSAFAAALGLACVNYAIRFVRWELYLRWQDVSVPMGSSALVFGAGLSLSITPAKLGELVKSYLLRELHDISATRTAPIVVAERVSDLLALLVLAVIGVAAYGVQTGLVIAAGALVTVGLVLLAWPAPTRWLIDLVTRPTFARKYRTSLHEVYAGLVGLCRPARLLTSTAIALPAWAAECVGFALIVRGFPGAHVDLGLAMVIYAATTIAGALSFLPGGLGVTEGAMTILLVRSATGVDQPTALDATLLTRLATLWFAVLLGLILLAIARGRIRARSQSPGVHGHPTRR
ncbi:MAG: lysylphosphatidylglycerol synthase transmembrane domain-containing protein [Kofleriaceae bacterium]|nr:lysylphosphatidylglycerol synthase transmembrane domain-containing protein [Kofleriaceae bacterium]